MSAVVINLCFSAAYIACSGCMIMYNATILKGVFPYPALLTTGHMVFSGLLSCALVNCEALGHGWIKDKLPADFLTLPAGMDLAKYKSAILPIAALQGASLWLSNLAYLYIGVSLIQMIKASNTVWTYMWSVPLGLTVWNNEKAFNLGVIGAGVAVAAMGAVEGSPIGMSIQLLGIVVEAARLALVQLLLQRRGLKLSPITALYFIAPAVVPLLLTIAFAKGEVAALFAAGWHFPLGMMLSNQLLAFSLNFIGFTVIARMSAVAYVLSGICKDVLLVSLGAAVWGEVVTGQQVAGYGVALAGLGYYNFPKSAQSPPPPEKSLASSLAPPAAADDDGGCQNPLLERVHGDKNSEDDEEAGPSDVAARHGKGQAAAVQVHEAFAAAEPASASRRSGRAV